MGNTLVHAWFGEHSCTRLVLGTLLDFVVGVGEDCQNRVVFAALSTGPAADQTPQTWAGRKNRLDVLADKDRLSTWRSFGYQQVIPLSVLLSLLSQHEHVHA